LPPNRPGGILPKNPLAMAAACSLKRWDKLVAYTKNGLL